VQTFGVGKFHLECHGRSAYNDVLKYGFDRAEVTEDIRAGDWLDWVARTHPDVYEDALLTVWPEPHLSDYGPTHRDLLEEIEEVRSRRCDTVRDRAGYISPVPAHASQTRWIADRAIAFIEERDRSRRFFLKVSFVDPHSPYDPPARYLDLISSEAIPEPVKSEDPALRALLQRFQPIGFLRRFADFRSEDWLRARHHYLASMAFLDEQVGRLMEALVDQGIRDDTVVIFTADHGDMLGDHGLPTKGPWHFDACMRVPLLIAGPGLQQGAVVDRVVTNLDLFPTITDFAGVDHDVPVEGESLRPLSARPAATGSDSLSAQRLNAALVETYGSYGTTLPQIRTRTVVTPDARLTLFEDGAAMLFDLAQDPLEMQAVSSLERNLGILLNRLTAHQYRRLPTWNRHPTAGH
jgi:choline-sulfatase